MIADRRSERLFNWLKTNVARADSRFPLFPGAAPTTAPERLSESHGLRCLIAATKLAAINLVAGPCAALPHRQSNLQKRRSQNSLLASSQRVAPDPENVKPNRASTRRRCASR